MIIGHRQYGLHLFLTPDFRSTALALGAMAIPAGMVLGRLGATIVTA
jgi:hypothetical protein